MYINIFNLNKSYKDQDVLKGISYCFKDSKKYLIKGENGSGKSTLIKSILSIIKYKGFIEIDGRISYLPELAYLPSYMKAITFIKTFATLTDDIDDFTNQIDNYFKIFNIDLNKKNAFIGSLSKGQKQKITIIMSLITPSDILIFDEPLTGLDSESKDKLISILEKDERMVIVISHEENRFNKKIFNIIEIEDGKFNVLSKTN